MEEMTIVYFLKKDSCAAKQKRRGEWQYFVEEKHISTPGGSLVLYRVWIPEYPYKKKYWQENVLADYLAGLDIPSQGRCVLYMYDKWAQALFCQGTEPLSEEWLLFLLAFYEPAFDGLIILADRELETAEIVWKYARSMRYIGLVAEWEEDCAELCEALSEEYGFLPDVAQDFKALHTGTAQNHLIIAADNLYGVTPAQLGRGCIWLSAKAGSGAKGICARAKNARYIDIEVFSEDVLRP